jgi:hypothetical protein
MKKIIGAASVVTAMFLSGCAGRPPQPVAVVQPQNRYADCAAIVIEVQANNQKIGDLAGEEGGKVAQNVAAGVVGLFVWPVLFGMDFQGAAGKEVAALQSRQQYLAVLAEQRNCAAPASPPVATPAPAVTPVPVAVTAHAPTPIPTPATAPAPAPGPAASPAIPTAAVAIPVPTPAGAWPNIIPPLSPSAAPAATADNPPPPYHLVPSSVAPAMPGAAPDANSYEQAQQQYRQAEQQYQRHLEQQRAQAR